MILRRLALSLLLISSIALAGPMNIISGARHFTQSSGGGTSEWADVYITDVANIGSNLATNGRKVGIRVGMTFTGLSQQLTSGNGATMDIVAGGSFDGRENAVRIYPPTNCIGAPCDDQHNAEYASWLRLLDLWNNGANNIAQINVRWLQYFGPTYYSNAPTAKIGGILAQDSLTPTGGGRRQAIWEVQDTINWTPYKYWGTTSNSVMYLPGAYIETEPDTSKLMQIAGAPNHSNNPPRIGGEWVCFEQIVDLRQDRGNANGMNKVLLYTRDGVVAGRYIQAPANWDGNWPFSYQYVANWEGLGFYYNKAGIADAGNYTMFSHVTFAANLGVGEQIGCQNIPSFTP